ncbi:CLUMA_CG002847, isoform A [Clunio marinus]|uniref:CLUMA_CG002847, isoform A n=1 Tax=Clunio marinus TaxID=568069 RepID=A0A1J1HN06_9DIPT|nr:CLUMA_CG002847, isoform A [Clunio marinus]
MIKYYCVSDATTEWKALMNFRISEFSSNNLEKCSHVNTFVNAVNSRLAIISLNKIEALKWLLPNVQKALKLRDIIAGSRAG